MKEVHSQKELIEAVKKAKKCDKIFFNEYPSQPQPNTTKPRRKSKSNCH